MEADLSVGDVCAALRVHPNTVRRWLNTGRIAGYQPGGTKAGWRIPLAEVERLKREGANDDRDSTTAA